MARKVYSNDDVIGSIKIIKCLGSRKRKNTSKTDRYYLCECLVTGAECKKLFDDK